MEAVKSVEVSSRTYNTCILRIFDCYFGASVACVSVCDDGVWSMVWSCVSRTLTCGKYGICNHRSWYAMRATNAEGVRGVRA